MSDLRAYVDGGGGSGLTAARETTSDAVIALLDSAGLRGRGGAGLPTARKWRSVVANRSASEPATVVVNAAEGEPGSFKDRWILRHNPYAVLEGALIAAHAVGADQVIVAMKRTFTVEAERVDTAIGEFEAAGWTAGVEVSIFEGPSEYLFGEETALLESIDGRYPFPRIAPPYRRGVDEIVDTADDVTSQSPSAAHVELAGSGGESTAPPALVSNTETFAHVAAILAHGAEWFRAVGTSGSPGTIVCTVSGDSVRHGVGEFAMGTPLREVIETIGGGAQPGRRLVAAMSGVANRPILASDWDTPLTYEAMTGVGSGLGAGGFLVFDDTTDFVAVAAGVSRFLAVESCGQCARCKQDGLALSDLLAGVAGSTVTAAPELDDLLTTVVNGARCNLATQQQVVVGGLLELFDDQLRGHLDGHAPPSAPMPVAAIVEIRDGRAVLAERQRDKQPDWTHDAEYSGKWPADRLGEHRSPEEEL